MTTNRQTSEEKLLTRRQLAAFLTEHGFPTGHSTLAKYCSPAINTGPPAECWWGKRPMYHPSRALEWARSRIRPAKDTPTTERAPVATSKKKHADGRVEPREQQRSTAA
jgi:hypothetical protein